MKIDLDIDKTIPKDVQDIIVRMETYVHDYAARSPETVAHIVSQMMQQIYFLGRIDGGKKVNETFTQALENLGKAVQS